MALLPPGVPHANDTGDELEDAVGGGEHAAREREREERVDQWEQEDQVGVPDPKWL